MNVDNVRKIFGLVGLISVVVGLVRFIDDRAGSATYFVITGAALITVSLHHPSEGPRRERSHAEKRIWLSLFVAAWLLFGSGALLIGIRAGGLMLVGGLLAFACCAVFAGALVRAWIREARPTR